MKEEGVLSEKLAYILLALVIMTLGGLGGKGVTFPWAPFRFFGQTD